MGHALYDTFNARYLTYQEVAESFVITEHFEKLTKNNHTLLMGPRGCGKTTLLKMLTLPALEKWDQISNSNYATIIPFHTIYIPTDIQWKRQLEELNKGFKNEESFTQLVSSATVTVNVLLALCETFSHLVKNLRTHSDFYQREAAFCKKVVSLWKLNGDIIPSIEGIRIALMQIIANLNAKTKRAVLYDQPFTDFEEIVFFEFNELVKIGCLAFEEHFDIENKSRWALCFDELEIAPDWLQYKLLEYLRSSDQKILYKLTTAPIVSLYRQVKDSFLIQAAENNDFNVVRIWNMNQSDKKSWFAFCEEISRNRIRKKYDNIKSIADLIGESDLDLGIIESNSFKPPAEGKDIYGHNTPTWHVFRRLAKIDESFRNFLRDKRINPSNPVPKNASERNEVFRKMRQLAIYRYHFKKEHSSRRSRKVVPLYFGTDILFEICDGNPRLFIGLLDEIIKSAETGARSARPLTINQQARIVTEMSERYLSVLAAYPGSTVLIGNKDKNIKDLIDEIGDYFYNKLINSEFTIDPATSFKIDEDVNSKLIELLELALYLGAIVYIDGKEAISQKGVIDKKFRLSYILAPYFRMLIREYKDVQLSTILKRANKDPNQYTILSE